CMCLPSQHVCDWIPCHLSRPSFRPVSLPTCLHHTWHFAVERQLPEAQPADAILAQKRPGAPAAPAAIAQAAFELRLLFLLQSGLDRGSALTGFCDLCGCCH